MRTSLRASSSCLMGLPSPGLETPSLKEACSGLVCIVGWQQFCLKLQKQECFGSGNQTGVRTWGLFFLVFSSFRNKGIATRSKKLLVSPGITTRNKDATRSKGHQLSLALRAWCLNLERRRLLAWADGSLKWRQSAFAGRPGNQDMSNLTPRSVLAPSSKARSP